MKKIYLLSLLLFSITVVKSQDAQFSQFYSSGLYLNPALAGAENNMLFSSNYREQWRSVKSPYITSQLSFISPIVNKSMKDRHIGGVGVSAFFDRAGDGNLKTSGFNASFAYNLPLSYSGKRYFTLGMQGGYVQKSIDPTNLQWGEQFNQYIGFDASKIPNQTLASYTTGYLDFNGGIMYYQKGIKEFTETGVDYYIGASAYHVNRPNESLVQDQTYKLPMLYRAHGGCQIGVNKHFLVSPNFLVAQQNVFRQYNVGAYLTYRVFNPKKTILAKTDVIFGAWYRLKDAFIFSTGIDNESYQIAFSYDLNTSSLRYATSGRGAWELSLILRLVKEKKLKRFSTPRI